MPVSWTEIPILSQFVVASRQGKGMSAEQDEQSGNSISIPREANNDSSTQKPLPKGVVLDKNGKP